MAVGNGGRPRRQRQCFRARLMEAPVLFVAAVSFLSGRDAPKRFGLQVILIDMAAIGLGVALVVVLNNPFRGQSQD
jgi:hypothetical protein